MSIIDTSYSTELAWIRLFERKRGMKEKMGDHSQERRNHPRTAIELHVEYKKLNSFFHDYTRNISQGGTFIHTPKPLEVGTELIFKLSVPEIKEPLCLLGQVKWIVLQEDGSDLSERKAPGMGIQFIYQSEENRLQVVSTVERLMKKHLGELVFAKLMGKR